MGVPWVSVRGFPACITSRAPSHLSGRRLYSKVRAWKIEALRRGGQQSWDLKGTLPAPDAPTKVSTTVGNGICISLLGLPEHSTRNQEGFTEMYYVTDTSLSLPFRKIQEEEGFTDIMHVQATCAQPHVSLSQFLPQLSLERLPGGEQAAGSMSQVVSCMSRAGWPWAF